MKSAINLFHASNKAKYLIAFPGSVHAPILCQHIYLYLSTMATAPQM
jgi:hypothetical protein